jgi:O-antigen ligase
MDGLAIVNSGERLNKTILLYLIILISFCDNIFLPIDVGFDFRIQYIGLTIGLSLFLLATKSVKIDVSHLFIYLFLWCLYLLVAVFKGYNFILFIKQFILINLLLALYYLLINFYSFNIRRIFKAYLNIASLGAIVGIIQFFSLLVGFKAGYDYSYLGFEMRNLDPKSLRIQSWLEEPSFLVYTIIPAAFIAIYNLFFSRKKYFISKLKSVFIILALLLTQSAIAYLGLFLIILLIVTSKYSFFKKPLIIISIALFIVSIASYLYNIPIIKSKIDDTVDMVLAPNPDINKINLSTYAMYSNFKVATESFKNDPIFGTGIGTYENIYDKYIDQAVPDNIFKYEYQLNRKDGDSLFLRLLVEGGILCIILFLTFTFYYRIKWNSNSGKDLNLWLINNGIFILILLRLLRMGHYTVLSFPLFLLIYYYSKRESRKKMR